MNSLRKNCDNCKYGNDGCDRVCDGTYSGWEQKSEQTGDLGGNIMINEFKKYDKESQRTVYIKTESFNRIMENANAAVRVIPRDVEVHNQYNAYLQTCEATGEEPLDVFEYGKTHASYSCSFETYENAPSNMLISKALGVEAVKVRYAKDHYGRITDDELEVTYHIA